MSVIKDVVADVRRFFGPRSIVNFAHQVSEKEQITAAWYVKDAREVHAIGQQMRRLFDTYEADFKAKLQLAKAAMEAELEANKTSEGTK